MVDNKKIKVTKEGTLRDISDYIYSCISRLSEHSDLLVYLGKHKEKFVEGSEKNKQSLSFIISIFDVYSRDAIIFLNMILDEDIKTSSFFTIVNYIEDNNRKKIFLRRLKKLKKELNGVVAARGSKVAHFNTKHNSYNNGNSHLVVPIEFDPRYIKKIIKRLETFFWSIKEELKIDGLMRFYREPIKDSFKRLIKGYKNNNNNK